ncbi:MAG TPA: DUF2249 domain-containing protein [Ktedonobacterales bacterium]|jgi:uncharacterized protein (DUF2249 family)
MSATTPQQLTGAIRTHHAALVESLDRYTADVESGLGDLDAASLITLLDDMTSFLSGELMPHAKGEERALYPALDPVLRQHGRPTASMSVDHEFLGDYVRQITEVAQSLRSSSGAQRAELERSLRRLMIQMQGLFHVHLAKEERVYLPLIEEVISAGDQQALLAALHEEAEAETPAELTADPLDVRTMPPAQRHQVIFARFDALPIGGRFTIVNDHDPKPLRYQLDAEYAGKVYWEYLQQGPEVWRVTMGKES